MTQYGHVYSFQDTDWDFTIPFVFEKVCYLPVKFQHNAYWALKELNVDLEKDGETRILQLHELEQLKRETYERVAIYKEGNGMKRTLSNEFSELGIKFSCTTPY